MENTISDKIRVINSKDLDMELFIEPVAETIKISAGKNYTFIAKGVSSPEGFDIEFSENGIIVHMPPNSGNLEVYDENNNLVYKLD